MGHLVLLVEAETNRCDALTIIAKDRVPELASFAPALAADEADRADKVTTQAGISDVFAGYVEKAAPRQSPVFRIERR